MKIVASSREGGFASSCSNSDLAFQYKSSATGSEGLEGLADSRGIQEEGSVRSLDNRSHENDEEKLTIRDKLVSC